MDRFRVAALTRFLEGELTPAQRQATLSVLTKKCTILAKGAARRGRHAEAERYRLLPDRFRSTSSFARGSSPGLNDGKPAEAGWVSDQPDSSGFLSFSRGLEATAVLRDSRD